MSRRRKKHKQGKGVYLNPEYEEIQDACRAGTVDVDHFGFVSCQRCDDGFGELGERCWNCNKKLRGTKVAVNLPAEIKGHSHQQGHQQGHFGTQHWESHTHKGDKVIHESDGKQLFAGNGRGVNEYSGSWDLIIDLAGNLRGLTPTGFVRPGSHTRFNDLKKHTFGAKPYPSEVLSLDWSDGSAPPASLDFWLSLYQMLPAKTVAMCIGGHGRTGTCLVALMIASGLDYYAAIQKVRVEHCAKAVETVTQELYLHQLYVEYLTRLSDESADEQTKQDIAQEITYAKDHVPNQQSSFGTKEVSKSGHSKSGTGRRPVLVDGLGRMESDTCRMIAGILYVKECAVMYCKADHTVAGCKDETHMGWVPFDPAIKS